MTDSPLLEVEGLRVKIGNVRAVSGVRFSVRRGEFYGIVGESGSGKSVTARAIIDLLPSHAEVEGSITLDGRNLRELSSKKMQEVRGSSVGFVFQDALAALDPVYTVGDQLVEVLRAKKTISKADATERATQLLTEVGIADPPRCMGSYPHQLSGGMRQRVVIAAALIADPDLIIADEPTTALDVTIQRQVLELLRKICDTRGTAVILITHDLAVVAETCDRVGVFYGGILVEEAATIDLFDSPRHPYTKALLKSLPKLGTTGNFEAIPGNPIRVQTKLDFCPFAARCSRVIPECTQEVPPERMLGAHRVRCFNPEEAVS